jgi:hypothetical protein
MCVVLSRRNLRKKSKETTLLLRQKAQGKTFYFCAFCRIWRLLSGFLPSSARGTLRLTPLEPNFIGMKRVLYAEKVVERCGFDGKNYGINGTKHSIVFQKHKDEWAHSSLCF